MAETPAPAPESAGSGGPLGVLGWASSLNNTLDDLSKVIPPFRPPPPPPPPPFSYIHLTLPTKREVVCSVCPGPI